MFIPALGNPLQVLCCSYQRLEIRSSLFATDNTIYQRGHIEAAVAHRGRGSCRVKLAHELLQLIICDRGRVCQHADRPVCMHCGPVSFAGPLHCYSHNGNTYCTSFIHSCPHSLTSHRTAQCIYVTDYRDEKLADEFIVSNRTRLRTVGLKF
jgi:hypothetical protein